jgi:hypothetical protein
MQITLNVPDTDAPQVIDGICAATGYDAASGKTKPQWAKEKLVAWIKDTAKRGLLRQQQTTIAASIDPVTIS